MRADVTDTRDRQLLSNVYQCVKIVDQIDAIDVECRVAMHESICALPDTQHALACSDRVTDSAGCNVHLKDACPEL